MLAAREAKCGNFIQAMLATLNSGVNVVNNR